MKLQLLFINGHLNAGGCERSLTDLLKHLDYDKYNVDLLLLEDLGDYISELPVQVNVIFYPLGQAFGPIKETIINAIKRKDWFALRYRLISLWSVRSGKEKLRYTRKLFSNVKKHYDAIIAYRPGICSELAAYTFFSSKKITWWHHGELSLSDEQVQNLNCVYDKFEVIVAVSSSSESILKEHFTNVYKKTIVIPNMVCISEIEKKAKEFSPFESENRELVLVSVGRMSPEKNMAICPDVGKALLENGIRFKWYLIGDGEDMQEIIRKIQQFNLSENFVLTGRLSNPYPYIANADILVHPSKVESQGLTVLEAMALRTLVVVVDSAGPREFIQNAVHGFIVKNSVESICSGIITAIHSQEETIINNAYMMVAAFSPKEIVNRFDKVIEQ